MNNDLISREALKENFEKAEEQADTYEMLVEFHKQIIDNAPTVQAFTLEDMQNNFDAGVDSVIGKYDKAEGEWARHDEWRGGEYIGGFYHVNCPCEDGYYSKWETNFCPNCGADMRKVVHKMTDKISSEDFIKAFGGSIEKRDNIMSYPAAADVIIEFREKLFDTFPEDVKKALALAVMVLSSSSNDGWIPVSERLPDDLEPVNITWINHNPEPYYKEIKDKPFTATGVYFNGQWYWWSTLCTDILAEYSHNFDDVIDADIEVIAWQPLPEPYKEGGADNEKAGM